MKRWSFEKQSLSQWSDPPVAHAADERLPPPSPASIARNSRENLRGGDQGRDLGRQIEEGSETKEDRR